MTNKQKALLNLLRSIPQEELDELQKKGLIGYIRVTNRDQSDLIEILRDFFPEGKKPGTSIYWKCNRSEVQRKLDKFRLKYPQFSDEQICTATKNYVEGFHGNYRYMQVLKYFISKNKIVNEEIEEGSELLSYLQNSNQKDESAITDFMGELF